jgi:transcriptional regulator
MYIPGQFEEKRPEILHALMRDYPLATLLVLSRGEMHVNHLPLLLQLENDQTVRLCGHVARANPVWQHLQAADQVIAVFQGPQAYISPSWYPSKQVDGKVVPTWNYAVVHAHGQAQVHDDADWLLHHLPQLTAQHENGRTQAWQVSDAPAEYIARLCQAIVGIEIRVKKLEGKWKVSQNRARADRDGVVQGLLHESGQQASAMAKLVQSAQ